MAGIQDHLMFGGAVALFAYTVLHNQLSFSIEAVAASIVFIFLGAVFPDIDHRGSVIHRVVKSFLILISMITAAVLAYPVPWAIIVSVLCTGTGTALLFSAVKPRHRGVTHSLSAATVFALSVATVMIFWFGTWVPAVFAFAAYLSHLALDGTLFKLRR